MSDASHVDGAVLGYRAWKLDGHALRSFTMRDRWDAEPKRAVCQYGTFRVQGDLPPTTSEGVVAGDEAHPAPHPECMCGLYAAHCAPPELGAYEVHGAVLAWGEIEVHPTGFRAEWAKPVVLAYASSQPYEHVTRLQAIAGELNLPCVELDQLEQTASVLGQPVAEELRPAPVARADQTVPISAAALMGSSMHGLSTQMTRRAALERGRRRHRQWVVILLALATVNAAGWAFSEEWWLDALIAVAHGSCLGNASMQARSARRCTRELDEL